MIFELNVLLVKLDQLFGIFFEYSLSFDSVDRTVLKLHIEQYFWFSGSNYAKFLRLLELLVEHFGSKSTLTGSIGLTSILLYIFF